MARIKSAPFQIKKGKNERVKYNIAYSGWFVGKKTVTSQLLFD